MPNIVFKTLAGLSLAVVASFCFSSQGATVQRACHLNNIPEQLVCGYLTVAEDSQNPKGKTIDVHYSLLPAIKDSYPNEAVLVIAGGPGQSAIDHAAYFNRTLSGVRQQRDILVIDQRGTGASNQLQCEFEAEDALQYLSAGFEAKEEVQRCKAELNTDLNHYTSLSALADFEAIRKELGYTKLHVFGVSYGTRMVQLYMKHHPDVVATAVMDGVVPMSQNVLAVGNSVDRAVELLFDQCEKQQGCEREYPEIRQEFSRLKASLEQTLVKSVRHPVSAEGSTLRLDQSKFLGLFRLALYSPQTRALLPYAIHQLNLGDAQPLLGLMSLTLDSNDMAMGMHSAIVCAEDWPRLSAEERAAIGQSLIGPEMIEGLDEICPIWGLKPSAADFSENIHSDIPSLLLSGHFDPATPPAWGEKAAEYLSNGRHVIAPFSTHGVAGQTCAKQLIEALITGTPAKELDASCIEQGVERQFFINANGSLSGVSPAKTEPTKTAVKNTKELEHD